jgi:aspartate/methionine/tyrosine aminotransferase
MSAEQFCREVVEKQGVLLLPSSKYDYGDQHFRIGYGRKNMPLALEQFDTYLMGKGE